MVHTVAGVGRTEGPVVRPDGALAFVSMSRGQVCQLEGSRWWVLANVGGVPNGLAEGADGTLYVAQAGAPRPLDPASSAVGGVQAVHPDGSWRWVTRDPIAPNDLCFGPDGLLYVTDPTRYPARDDGRIWRCDPKSGEVELLASLGWYPNGIGFGVDDEMLYVASTGDSRMMRLPLQGSRLGPAEVLFQMEVGHPDGFAFDREGDLVLGAVTLDGSPGTIQVWNPAGELVETIQPVESGRYTNVALGPDGTLYATNIDAEAVHVLPRWGNPGLPLHPLRGGDA